MKFPIYMDYNATTPCDKRVVEAMLPYFSETFGNAASHHHYYGWQADAAVQKAREAVAQIIHADAREIVFTSGATEAANLALKGVFETYKGRECHIITTNAEHKAVLDTCRFLEKNGADITYLPVNNEGLITAEQVEEVIRPDTVLIAVMYANNETGVIMPVKEIGAVAKKNSVMFFSDATQAVGKIDVDVQSDGIDILALSAHKFYGPKGAGALFMRRRHPRVALTAQIHGGGHEKGLRSGTLNVPAIVGLGKACEIALEEIEMHQKNTEAMRNKLEKALLQIEDSFVNGCRQNRLPHVTNIGFQFLDGEALMAGLKKELAISSGSACTSASIEPSYVLKAMGLSNDMAHGSLRFSIGRFTTDDEIKFVIDAVTKKITELRAMNPIWQMYKQGVNLKD